MTECVFPPLRGARGPVRVSPDTEHGDRRRCCATVRMRARVRAPVLRGRRWLGTGGRDVGPEELRGRIVLIDFWTAGRVKFV